MGQKDAMQMFLNEGINQHNENESLKENPSYQRKRRALNQADFIKCSKCSITIQKRSFYRHRKVCSAKNRCHRNSIFSISTFKNNLPNHLSEDYKQHILEKFRNDTIGSLCRRDEVLIEIGKVFYGKVHRKRDKRVQVCKKISSSK